MLKVCYLKDITAVNNFNTSMQGRNQNIITLSEKLSTFKEMLQIWKMKLERGRKVAFPSRYEYLEQGLQTTAGSKCGPRSYFVKS